MITCRAQRSANRQKIYKKSADHINSDKIKLYTTIRHTRNSNILQYQLFNTRTNYFKFSYFPHTVVLWNSLSTSTFYDNPSMVMITCRAQRSANRQKNYKKSADHINSDKIKLYTKFIYKLKFVV
jgi:hypothetical protein